MGLSTLALGIVIAAAVITALLLLYCEYDRRRYWKKREALSRSQFEGNPAKKSSSSGKSTQDHHKSAVIQKTIPVDPELGRTSSRRFNTNNQYFFRGSIPRQSPRPAERLSSTKSTEKRNKNATPKTIPVDPEYGRTSQRFDINNEFFNRGPAPRQSPRAAQYARETYQKSPSRMGSDKKLTREPSGRLKQQKGTPQKSSRRFLFANAQQRYGGQGSVRLLPPTQTRRK